jgi:hypothetical protein
MIFGKPPTFDDLLEFARALDRDQQVSSELNRAGSIENRSRLKKV